MPIQRNLLATDYIKPENGVRRKARQIPHQGTTLFHISTHHSPFAPQN
jgi:hypothetical protein